MIKNCEWCGNEYNGAKNSRFCKDTHYKKCENCGEDFAIKEMKRPKKSCSKECADALTVKNNTVKRTCELCEKEFETLNKRARFCNEKHMINCIICKEEFELYNPHKPSTTCSSTCASRLIDYEKRNGKSAVTNVKKYGVKNVSQNRNIKEKKKQASLTKYGVENISQAKEVKEKREKSLLENYGVINPMFSKVIQDRLEDKIYKKYGVSNVFSHKGIQSKIKKSLMEKYGVENISKLQENKIKVRQTTLDRFGVESVFSLPENQIKAALGNKRRISKVNKKWQTFIQEKTGYTFDFEQSIDENSYADLGHKNILIDINPTITHNASIAFAHFANLCKKENCIKKNHLPKNKDYHQKRALAAEKDNKVLLQYFEWFDRDIFLEIIKAKLNSVENRVPAKKTVLKEIKQSEANRFFRSNHLLGASNGQKLCLGLFYGDELVHCQSYGPARISKKAEWEAIRSCSKLGYQIQGGFSKCDKYFFKKINPHSVVSYVDMSISQGKTDNMFSGWRLQSINPPSATWVKTMKTDGNDNHPLFIRDSTARRISADRLLGFEVGEKYPRYDDIGNKISNDDILLSEGYLKVYDAGTKTFIWEESVL